MNTSSKQGVGRAFWVTTVVVFVAMLIETILGGHGINLIEIPLTLLVAVPCGIVAEAISSLCKLIHSGQFRLKHVLVMVTVMIISVGLGLLYSRISKPVRGVLYTHFMFGMLCFQLGVMITARRLSKNTGFMNKALETTSGNALRTPPEAPQG